MDERILALLSAVAGGTLSVQAAFEELKDVPFQDLTHTKIDLHRQLQERHPGGHFRRRQDIRAD